jgi:eukaryotic-like serine/threonine-protein kinase
LILPRQCKVIALWISPVLGACSLVPLPCPRLDSLSKIVRQTAHSRARVSRSLSLGWGLLRRNLWVWPLLAAGMLAVAGLRIRGDIEMAAQMEMADGLEATLNSNVEALKLWLETEEQQALAAASEVEIRRLAGELNRLAALPDSAALVQSPLQEEFKSALRPILAGKHFAGYILLDRDRRILASDRTELIGQVRATNYDLVARTLEKGATVTPPVPSAVLMPGSDGTLRAGQPTMFALAAQRDLTGNIVGVLGLRIRPDEDFVRILQIGRSGVRGDTFAFDKDGLLLSESRVTPELIRLGLVPDVPGARSQLTVSLRDPGVDMTSGARPARPRSEQPLTVMAVSATNGNSGQNVTGYRDYRGVPVVGAWTWLGEYGMGVATEKEVAKAYGSLVILRRAFWSLFGLLAASSVLILVFSLAMDRVQRAAQKAVLEAKQLGQYQLEEKLGEGGMGVVYRGCHRMLRRATAIKLLHPDKTTDDTIQRFEREVQLTCQLNHPNTIAIYDYGRTPEGVFYYAMEYLDGVNLDSLVRRYGPQPEGRVISILRQICGSLAEAHEIGLVHRDIKPANIVLSRRGGECDVAKVLDFGLVKAVDSKKESSLTSAGAVIGTPLYMSPEAVDSPDRIDGRSDLYAVSSVGYFLLTGTPPFEGQSIIEICMHHARTPPEPPSQRLKRAVSPDLEAALLKGLAKNPLERFQTAREFSAALAACPAAATWTSGMADAWWQAHAQHGDSPPGGPTTAAIANAVTVELAAGVAAT